MTEQTKPPTEQEQTDGADYTTDGDDKAGDGGDRKPTGDEKRGRKVQKAEKGEEQEDAVARVTSVGLHMVEDVIYALTALVLVGGSLVVLVQAVWEFSTTVPDGVTKAIEATVGSLLIVFILVELLSAVRSAILEHRLVAEPFLLVGILAAIKELVLLSTFKLESGKATETMMKIGGLAGVVLALGIATLFLRRKEREPDEGDSGPPAPERRVD